MMFGLYEDVKASLEVVKIDIIRNDVFESIVITVQFVWRSSQIQYSLPKCSIPLPVLHMPFFSLSPKMSHNIKL